MRTRSHPHMDFCDAVSSECAGQTSGMRVIPGLMGPFFFPFSPLSTHCCFQALFCLLAPSSRSLWGFGFGYQSATAPHDLDSHGFCSIATPRHAEPARSGFCGGWGWATSLAATLLPLRSEVYQATQTGAAQESITPTDAVGGGTCFNCHELS